MRFVAFVTSAGRGIGVRVGEEIRGLHEFAPLFPGHLEDLVRSGKGALIEAGEVLRALQPINQAQMTWLPPLGEPPKIICVGLNYADHSAESGFAIPAYPTIFARFASSLIGHETEIVRPHVSTQLDYEGELVAVIGKGGRHIARENALDHVIGYSVFNDASIRDYQTKSPQWTIGKNFDRTGAFGPELVTSDELPDGAKGLRIQTRLNGRIVQDASTADMVFDIAHLIALLSEAMTLEAGDIIVSGTPSGVGMARKPQLWMKPGDLCEVEIEAIGILRNRVSDEGGAHSGRTNVST